MRKRDHAGLGLDRRQPRSSRDPTTGDQYWEVGFSPAIDRSLLARLSGTICQPGGITFGFPVTREQAGSLNAGTCITILPEVPHLEQQAIPRAAIPNCTNHFSLVNTLRESRFDSACFIEGFQLFGGEFHIQTGEIVLELRYLPRSNDRDYWNRLMAQPGECDLRHAATGLFGDRL